MSFENRWPDGSRMDRIMKALDCRKNSVDAIYTDYELFQEAVEIIDNLSSYKHEYDVRYLPTVRTLAVHADQFLNQITERLGV